MFKYKILKKIVLSLVSYSFYLQGVEAFQAKMTSAELLGSSKSSDWRSLAPENTLYMEMNSGRVVIELAPDFAPKHVENIKALAREKFWDDLSIVRLQDNYVAQWGDPNAEKPNAKKILKAKPTLAAEFDRSLDAKIPFTVLPDKDVYANEVGFSNGFPVARDSSNNKMWLAHCYAMVGAGRNDPPESGGGAELYAVIGHAPRHLDRNVTLVGKVLQGIEKLSSLPRGTGPLGFYEKPGQRVAIRSLRLAKDIPQKERTELEVLRTDTPLFANWMAARQNRSESWFFQPAGHIDLCNITIPVREKLKK